MTFREPVYLFCLLVVPLAISGYLLLQRLRRRDAARFSTPALLPNVVDRSPRWRRHVPAAVFLLALATLLVGMARPQAAVSTRREQATVVLAIDTSRSMAAKDVRPTRLAAAQAAARTFIEEIPKKYRVGLISFATTAAAVSPAIYDRPFLLASLDALRPGEGTALGEAIVRAIKVGRAVPGQNDKGGRRVAPPLSVLLISDGTASSGGVTPEQAAQRARRLGVRVYTVALGTDRGVVEVPRVGGIAGIGGYVERIRVPPSPDTLERLATTTRGRFFSAPNRTALQSVYRDLASRLGKTTKKKEVSFAFAAGGALLLLAGGALSAVWFRRVP